MDDFWENLSETPDKKALVTKRGLRISFSRKELMDFFGVLLEKRPLECMVGEAAHWVLIPSLVSIYSFPVILYFSHNPWYSLMAALGLLMSMSIFNQSSYNYMINKYLVRPASSMIPKFAVNFTFALLLNRTGNDLWLVVLPFIWWIFNDFLPIVYLVSELLLIKIKSWMWNLADPDGVLRQVGIYWAKQFNLSINQNGKIIP